MIPSFEEHEKYQYPLVLYKDLRYYLFLQNIKSLVWGNSGVQVEGGKKEKVEKKKLKPTTLVLLLNFLSNSKHG